MSDYEKTKQLSSNGITEEDYKMEIAKILLLLPEKVINFKLPIYKCEVQGCPFQTNRNWNLTRHMRNLHKSRKSRRSTKYICFSCNYMFTSWINLQRHSRVHCTDDRPIFTCRSCGWLTNLEADLKKHDKMVHDDIEECKFE